MRPLIALVLLAGCASPKPAADQQPSAVVVEVPVAAPAPGPPKFRPDLPLAGLAPASTVATKTCKTEDVVLGDASDVVQAHGWMYPVSIAFGPEGGLAVWMHDGRLVSRALDRDGHPRGAVVEGPSWALPPRVWASGEGFVLTEVDDGRLLVLPTSSQGTPAGGPWAVDMPKDLHDASLVLTSPRELTLLAPRRGQEAESFHLGVFTVDFAGAEPRTKLRDIAIDHLPASDAEYVPGAYGDERAVVMASPSKELALIRGNALETLSLDAFSRDVDRYLDLVPFGLGSSSDGYDFGVVAHTTYPSLPFEDVHTPPTVKVRLTDPEWRGLGEPVWTGTRFVLSRLSGAEPHTQARLFVMDCR